nr:retrovirus-related Pol polyprotein from transposon TNT 1-94 [Tanacetum cinerariifolium]
MTFEEVEAKFNSVWKQMEDFIPTGSKEEAERINRKGINLEQESAKKQKTSEEVTKEAKPPKEVTEEKVKEMMQLIPIEEVYVKALQVKHPIIDWKHLDREDLNQLWRLVKETLSNRPPTSNKEMELWVELNRMYEPDKEDQLVVITLEDPIINSFKQVVSELDTTDTTTITTTSGETGTKSGRTVTLTVEDMKKKKNDVKARTTLLLSLLDEHQLRFSKYKTAQELWAAILKTFGGNEATKKTKKNLLKQQYGNFRVEGSETLEQTNVLDTMSLDDLYNHLKVYESEVQKKTEPNSQNMAFISSTKHSSGKEDGVDNTAKTKRPQPKSNAKNDRVPYAFKSSCSKNKEVEVEEHPRNLLLSMNKKHIKKQKANVPNIRNQKKQMPKVMKPKKVGSNERLALPKPTKPRYCLRWSPTGRLFDLKGKIIAFTESKSQSHCSNGDNACNYNPSKPTINQFPNFTSFLGRVYFVEGLRHNLFSVRQFCNSDLEVAFRRNTCFGRNIEGVNLLKENRTTNLYTINLHEMASASPICLMVRATSTKSWLRHQRLSHLSFDTINDLAKNDLVTGLPKFKYHKEHLCPSCEQGKSKKASHPPKPVPNSKQRLQGMSSGQISLGLDLTYALSTITTRQPTERELDLLFITMYDDYIGVQPSAAPRTTTAAQAPLVRQTSTASITIATPHQHQ